MQIAIPILLMAQLVMADASKTEAADWRPLFDGKTLAGWKQAEFGGDGPLEVENGVVRLGIGEPFSGLVRTGDFPRINYEIELEARRIDGGDFFCGLTFPVAATHCSLILGGWGGGLVGLSSLDGFDASENETGQWNDFKDNQWYKVRLRVTDKRIQAWINDESAVDVDTRGRKIDIRVDVSPCKPLGLATWRTAAEYRNARYRALPKKEITPPNFVIILADDLGYGDLSCYGNKSWQTPNLDRLAAEGLRFTDFHSSGAVCSPTRTGLLTGRYQQRAGIEGVIYADPARNRHHGLQPHEVTFAELLRDAGYATAIAGKWHLGYKPEYNPMKQGFQRFRGYLSGNIDYFSHVDQSGAFDWWHDDKTTQETGYSTHLITRHAVEFIEQNKDRPFCLYVAHEAVHAPYQGPKDEPIRTAGKTAKGKGESDVPRAYREMLAEMDKGVGEIMDSLKRHSLGESTLVFFFSDNGGTPNGSNAPLRGHKGSLWEGGHRVPAIARWTRRIAPGKVTDQLATCIDLLPTLLALADVPPPSGHALDGLDLSPLLLTGQPIGLRSVFWKHQAQTAAREGKWKLLRVDGAADVQLFDLSHDVGESRNLAAEQPARVETMQAALDDWLRDINRGSTAQPER